MNRLRLTSVAVLAGALVLVSQLAARSVDAAVVINEVMYNAPGAADPAFVELHNAGPTAVAVDGWWLLDDDDTHTPCLLSGTIPPGGFLVVAESISTFQSAYPGAGPINATPYADGQPDGGFLLGKGGDEVRLFDGSGTVIDRVPYDDVAPWPTEADGNGSSLERLNPSLDGASATSWAASPAANPPGSPGQVNATFDPDIAPRIEPVARTPLLPTSDDAVSVTATIVDDLDTPTAQLFVDDGGGGFTAMPMFDDGGNGDGDAGDGLFGALIPARPDGTVVRYYVEATDGSAQSSRAPDDAPASWFAYTVGHRPPRLVINELVASNQNGILDPAGDRDDWLEIRNAGVEPVALGGLFLSDDPLDPQRWPLPGIQLDPHAFALIWCDGETAQGTFHADFTLPRAGGFVGLYDAIDRGNTQIDSRRFGPQNPDISFGRLPDDADRAEYIATPTPAAPNAGSQPYASIVVNELLAASAVGAADFVELFNRGDATVNLGGWHLSDDPEQLTRFAIPAGTLLPPGGLVAFDAAQLGFGFNAAGESVLLTAPDEVTVFDAIEFGPLPTDVSLGRLADGDTDWHRFSVWTRQLPNICAAGADTPGAVRGLRFDTPVVLRWDDQGEPGSYDVVRGELASLRASGGPFDAECHENNVPQAASFAPEPVAAGSGLYYLVRAVNDRCGFGSFTGEGDGESPGRDQALLSATGCP